MRELPIRSMTGYAMMRRQTGAGELTLSLRTVNHRGLDAHFHHSSEFIQFESAMREVLKGNMARGHVEIRASLRRQEGGEVVSVDRRVLMRYVTAFRETARELGVAVQPDVNVLMQLPGVLTHGEKEGDEESSALDGKFEKDLVATLSACVHELNLCREREGVALADHVVEELSGIEAKTAEVAAIRAGATEQFQQRLRDRLGELLGGSMPENRLAEEAAILADRSDVQEEVTRLRVHAEELRRIVEGGGEIGKRLDFLLQEMNREINTVLSKTSGVGKVGLKITSLGLGIKAHIEKIREQALNLE